MYGAKTVIESHVVCNPGLCKWKAASVPCCSATIHSLRENGLDCTGVYSTAGLVYVIQIYPLLCKMHKGEQWKEAFWSRKAQLKAKSFTVALVLSSLLKWDPCVKALWDDSAGPEECSKGGSIWRWMKREENSETQTVLHNSRRLLLGC